MDKKITSKHRRADKNNVRCKMFLYTDNKQLKKEFKKIVIDENLTMSSVANKLGIVPQQLNNKFNNSRIAVSDLQIWLDCIDYDLEINFKKRKE